MICFAGSGEIEMQQVEQQHADITLVQRGDQSVRQ